MIGYVFRRLAQLVPTVFLVSVLVFCLTMLLPGDPTTSMLGEDATAAQRAALRAELGLDRPVPVQYVAWLLSALQGDLGTSLKTGESVASMLSTRLPVTVELAVLSILFAIAVGIPAGVLAARYRSSPVDVAVSTVALFGLAVPYFWAGMLLIILFSVRLGWLPPSGYTPFFVDPVTNLKLMILPSITIGTAMAALVMRQTRAAMLQVLSQDYIRTARAKGVPAFTIIVKHGLRNCLIPVTTVVGLQVGTLISGAVITETIFSLPGLGRMVVDGIFARDFPIVQGAIVFIILFVLLVNLVTDLLYAVLDPRVRL